MNILPKYLEGLILDFKEIKHHDEALSGKGKLQCECGCNDFAVFQEKEILTEQQKKWTKQLNRIIREHSNILQRKDGTWRLATETGNGKQKIGYYGEIDSYGLTTFHVIETIDYPEMSTTPCVIVVKCPKCEKSYEVFNSSKHGYDGVCKNIPYSSTEYVLRPAKKCSKCKNSQFNVIVKIDSTGKEDLLKQSNGAITEENWTNAFAWITIDLKCLICGKVSKGWFDHETM